ncbi:prepilin-type N-terminal cleavage/methylation domain-containing protein [Candidatus Parcubacteria bacterium]|nr:prepilin-type N-terminal cleavage/methylation domain-containing protein [Candidatus Parcubacteria bacterium]
MKSSKGITLVEVLIASAIISVFIVALLSVHTLYLRSALKNSSSIQASYLIEEGIEAARFLRDSAWVNISSLTPGTDYGMAFYNGTWQASTTALYVDSFLRTVTVSAVSRDSTSRDIVTSGGVNDPNTRKITSSVSWVSNGATTTRSISTYLTNIYAE